MSTFLTQYVELFFGECTATLGRLYARLPLDAVAALGQVSGDKPGSRCCFSGTIAGPQSRYAHTLSAKISLMARISGSTWWLEGAVPDPCFWTPDAPYLYQVTCRLSDAVNATSPTDNKAALDERATFAFGFRPLGAKATSLYLAGNRWVPRGWVFSADQQPIMIEAHEAVVALASADTEIDALLADAATVGALAVRLVRSETDAAQLHATMRGQHPAVGLVAFDAEYASPDPRFKYGNAVLAEWLRQPPPWQPAPWAQAVIVELTDMSALAAARQLPLPVMVYRPDATVRSATGARAACNALQRDATLYGDFAGYLV